MAGRKYTDFARRKVKPGNSGAPDGRLDAGPVDFVAIPMDGKCKQRLPLLAARGAQRIWTTAPERS
jgi:hypothetical protein